MKSMDYDFDRSTIDRVIRIMRYTLDTKHIPIIFLYLLSGLFAGRAYTAFVLKAEEPEGTYRNWDRVEMSLTLDPAHGTRFASTG